MKYSKGPIVGSGPTYICHRFLEFSSGRKIRCLGGVIGMDVSDDGDLFITSGYDNISVPTVLNYPYNKLFKTIYPSFDDCPEKNFTPDEKKELSDYMIDRWKRWA